MSTPSVSSPSYDHNICLNEDPTFNQAEELYCEDPTAEQWSNSDQKKYSDLTQPKPTALTAPVFAPSFPGSLFLTLLSCSKLTPEILGDTAYPELPPDDCDLDGDGYFSTDCTEYKPDCNDNDATVHPNAEELCDGIDQDCDDRIDEGAKTTYYIDNDNDGYGTNDDTEASCSTPSGYADNNDDCNDSDANVYPGAAGSLDCNGRGTWFGVDCDDAGHSYSSIQSAVDAVNDGDEIRICAGTYREDVTINNKDLTIISSEDATLTGGGSVKLSNSNSDITGIILDDMSGFEISNSTVNFENITIQNGSGSININDSLVHLNNSNINYTDGISEVSGSSDLYIANTSIYRHEGRIFYVTNNGWIRMESTTVDNSYTYASIYLEGEGGAEASANLSIASDCSVNNDAGYDVTMSSSDGISYMFSTAYDLWCATHNRVCLYQ